MLTKYEVWQSENYKIRTIEASSEKEAVLLFLKQTHEHCPFGHTITVHIGTEINSKTFKVVHKIMSTFDIDPV